MKYIVITSCMNCPFHFLEKDDFSPWSADLCSKLSKNDGYIHDINSILPNCPLNDVTNDMCDKTGYSTH